ncbi:unnamed protein product [Linum tenue]|uniref:Uncharacterized protein n=1 Tax=Linum tenue TaxID=586396 RepID=A0AAV0JQC4_9ROSI|nr:unnamed protein product [Linum tenue]
MGRAVCGVNKPDQGGAQV